MVREEEEGCMGLEAPLAEEFGPFFMWGRGIFMLITLPLFPLCPSSVHCQLSPHDPQPGLTYSKDMATALLKKHDQPLRESPKAGFLSGRGHEKMSEENENRTCLVCPHP